MQEISKKNDWRIMYACALAHILQRVSKKYLYAQKFSCIKLRSNCSYRMYGFFLLISWLFKNYICLPLIFVISLLRSASFNSNVLAAIFSEKCSYGFKENKFEILQISYWTLSGKIVIYYVKFERNVSMKYKIPVSLFEVNWLIRIVETASLKSHYIMKI